jgi:NAD(P)-dependent dehydrogenase (short-subunit alcohol dehydrogenase family)
MRLKDKVAIVVGAGQSPGEGLGNGRATVLRFAQEGAKVLAVDNNLSSAEETVAMLTGHDGATQVDGSDAVERILGDPVERRVPRPRQRYSRRHCSGGRRCAPNVAVRPRSSRREWSRW